MSAVVSPTLIYDGGCAFCVRWVRRLERWDRAGAIDLIELQDDRAPQIARRSPAQLKSAMHLVLPNGEVHDGADAARVLFGFLRHGRLPQLLFSVPGVMPIARRVYGWVADHRYRVGCDTQSCEVPLANGPTER